MPTYVYEVIDKEGEPGERFELVQKMTRPAADRPSRNRTEGAAGVPADPNRGPDVSPR